MENTWAHGGQGMVGVLRSTLFRQRIPEGLGHWVEGSYLRPRR